MFNLQIYLIAESVKVIWFGVKCLSHDLNELWWAARKPNLILAEMEELDPKLDRNDMTRCRDLDLAVKMKINFIRYSPNCWQLSAFEVSGLPPWRLQFRSMFKCDTWNFVGIVESLGVTRERRLLYLRPTWNAGRSSLIFRLKIHLVAFTFTSRSDERCKSL